MIYNIIYTWIYTDYRDTAESEKNHSDGTMESSELFNRSTGFAGFPSCHGPSCRTSHWIMT